jgi:hypothetical protein
MPSDTNASPELGDTIDEVQGIFPSDDTLQAAMKRLLGNGFDRAELSLPHTSPSSATATPNQGAENPTTEEDQRQIRTLGASTLGVGAAMAAAGVVIATGGVALAAVGAAAAAGVAAGGAVEGASGVAKSAEHNNRQEAAQVGQLVLSAHVADVEKLRRAETVMRECGATRVEAVRRIGAAVAGVDSGGWTG